MRDEAGEEHRRRSLRDDVLAVAEGRGLRAVPDRAQRLLDGATARRGLVAGAGAARHPVHRAEDPAADLSADVPARRGCHDQSVQIVRTGTWLYDGTSEMPVDVVGLPYDFWYEIGRANGELQPGETPQEGDADGFLYHLRFTRAGSTTEPTWVDSQAHTTVEEAMATAGLKAPSPIRWR